MLTVHVRLFAAIRETLGRDTVTLTLPAGATPEDAWRSLVALEGGAPLASRRLNLAAAVNRKYSGFDAVLSDGDEVVFIPPVSGG